ncbi:MAG: SLC13 family permease [Verrucomicrobiales bacterium]|nr:SLC13 family permease [Verrucomicrobiales bacterium]
MLLLLGLILVSLVFFWGDWVSSDIVALGLLLLLIFTGLLTPRDAFAGFGSDTVLMTFGLLLLTGTLVKTGAVQLVGQAIHSRVRGGPVVLLGVIMMTVAGMSALVSNTATAAFFVPVVVGLAARAGQSPSKFLLPVAFASILSSSVTLISTSTNLVVSGLMVTSGLAPLGMFELTPVGLPIVLLGLTYMMLLGRRLIPDRSGPPGLIDQFGMRSYLTEVLILENSPLVGRTLGESGLGRDLDFTVIRLLRGKDQYLQPRSNLVLQSLDVLLVEGPRQEVLKVKDVAGIEIKADVTLADPSVKSADLALVEALVIPGSSLSGRTLNSVRFRDRYNLQVLGLNRHGKNLLTKLSRIGLRVGDVLLLQGAKSAFVSLEEDRALSILGEVSEDRPDRTKALRAGGIFLFVLVLGSLGVMTLPVAVLLGAFLTLATRCVTAEAAYREIEWRAIILIACMLGLGVAMEKTGTAKALASLLAGFVEHWNPLWLLAGFFAITTLLTQPMSNQAAAAVVLPIAVQTAAQLGLNPRPFAVMIALAASCSFLTPLEPACLLVYGPGRYRFGDFFRVGFPLVIAIFLLSVFLVPKFWPLRVIGASSP